MASGGSGVITVTVADEEGRTALLQVAADATVGTLKALVAAEMGVPPAQQALLKDGQPLRSDDAPLSASGVGDNDFLFLMRGAATTTGGGANSSTASSASTAAAASSGAGQGQQLRSLADLPPNVDPQGLVTLLKDNPRLLRELSHHNGPLAEAIGTGDVVKVRGVLMKQRLQAAAARVEEENAYAALEANPLDPENQRRIEELINKQNVTRNMEMAMEEMPEAFGSVIMLYIDAEVNGQPIKAFVDSGAQSTIMSAACAARCNLTRLIDTRFAGVAKGVGTSKILGRIHMFQLKVGQAFFPCTFTVLENDDVDFLFGLDMLKRHQCVIDLRRSVLEIGSAGLSVPFLAEKDLPPGARGHIAGSGSGSQQNSNEAEDPELASALKESASAMSVASDNGNGNGGGKAPNPPPTSGGGNGSSSAVGGGGGATPGAATAAAAGAGAAGAGAGSGAAADPAAVAQLMSMGFSREQVVAALQRTNGNVDDAVALLLAQFS